jgi:hypothetical protein
MQALRMITGSLICCVSIQTGGVRRFAGERGEDWEWREGRGSPDGVGIGRKCLQRLQTSASDLGSLAASSSERRGRGERGEWGLCRGGIGGHSRRR